MPLWKIHHPGASNLLDKNKFVAEIIQVYDAVPLPRMFFVVVIWRWPRPAFSSAARPPTRSSGSRTSSSRGPCPARSSPNGGSRTSSIWSRPGSEATAINRNPDHRNGPRTGVAAGHPPPAHSVAGQLSLKTRGPPDSLKTSPDAARPPDPGSRNPRYLGYHGRRDPVPPATPQIPETPDSPPQHREVSQPVKPPCLPRASHPPIHLRGPADRPPADLDIAQRPKRRIAAQPPHLHHRGVPCRRAHRTPRPK